MRDTFGSQLRVIAGLTFTALGAIAVALVSVVGDDIPLSAPVLVSLQLLFFGGVVTAWGIKHQDEGGIGTRVRWLALVWCYSGIVILAIESERILGISRAADSAGVLIGVLLAFGVVCLLLGALFSIVLAIAGVALLIGSRDRSA